VTDETRIDIPDEFAAEIAAADAETRRQRGIDRHLPAESQFDLETEEGRAAAYERANELSEELAAIDRETKATILPAWQRRIAEQEHIRDSAQAAIDELEHQRDSALKGVEDSCEWRLDWLDRYRQLPAAQKQLRIKGRKRSLPLAGGEYRWHDNATRTDWVHDIQGKRDDEAIEAAVEDLYSLGLVGSWDTLKPAGERKVAIGKAKDKLELDADGVAWWQLVVEDTPSELWERVEADGGSIEPFTSETDRETGEVKVKSYVARFRALAEVKHRDAEGRETVVRTVDNLLRRYTPEDRGEPPYKREFVPAGTPEAAAGQTEEMEEDDVSGTDE
jgi:hypothetical protein